MGRRANRRGIWTFYKDTFPGIFRETFPDTFAAFVLFLVAGLAGVLMSLADPGFSQYFLGPQMMQSIDNHKMWTDSIVTVKPLASSGIMTNNMSVAFAAFAFGITAGIGTVWMMLLNGLMMGVVGVACWREGMSLSLLEFRSGARRAGVAGDFHCRRGGPRDREGIAVSWCAAPERIAGAGGGAKCAPGAGDDTVAVDCWNCRGVRFADWAGAAMMKFLLAAGFATLLVLYLTSCGKDRPKLVRSLRHRDRVGGAGVCLKAQSELSQSNLDQAAFFGARGIGSRSPKRVVRDQPPASARLADAACVAGRRGVARFLARQRGGTFRARFRDARGEVRAVPAGQSR